MNKTTLLSYSVVILLVLNLALVSFLVFGKSQPEHRSAKGHKRLKDGPKQEIIAQLNLDEEQQAAYTILIEAHKRDIDQHGVKIQTAKQKIFELLKAEDHSPKDALIATISHHQIQIEEIHFQHFLDLKGLCKPDQIDDFNALTGELGRLFSPKRRKP